MKYLLIRKNLRKVYDELAEYWGNDEKLHDWGDEELKRFADLVKKNGGKAMPAGRQVLELGCGSGVQSKQLSDLGLEVVGIDISPNMVLEARKRAPKANFLVGDIATVRFPKVSFDGIYARASLLHIPKELIPKVFEAINKMLKVGGIFYLAVKEGKGEGEVVDSRHGINVKRFFSFFVKEEIEKLLEEAKFKILDLNTYSRVGGSTTWIQVIAQKA